MDEMRQKKKALLLEFIELILGEGSRIVATLDDRLATLDPQVLGETGKAGGIGVPNLGIGIRCTREFGCIGELFTDGVVEN
jgi:hypothetical protein